MGRTNIDIDDDLVMQTMRVTGTRTKKAAIEEAMRRTVRNDELRQALERLPRHRLGRPPMEDRQFREDGTVYYASDEK
jgi:Arc/MetJ family transcription regulator